jgi:hypothetical protein
LISDFTPNIDANSNNSCFKLLSIMLLVIY